MFAVTVNNGSPLGTRQCCDVESTSLTLNQRRNNVVCPVGKNVFFIPSTIPVLDDFVTLHTISYLPLMSRIFR